MTIIDREELMEVTRESMPFDLFLAEKNATMHMVFSILGSCGELKKESNRTPIDAFNGVFDFRSRARYAAVGQLISTLVLLNKNNQVTLNSESNNDFLRERTNQTMSLFAEFVATETDAVNAAAPFETIEWESAERYRDFSDLDAKRQDLISFRRKGQTVDVSCTYDLYRLIDQTKTPGRSMGIDAVKFYFTPR